MEHTIYLALGSNLGDRRRNLDTAIQGLAPDIDVITRSSIYETPPWGYQDQPAFLNMVIQAKTLFLPRKLLKFLKGVEKRMGRQPNFRNGPRLIDIDILFYGQEILDQPGLTIPHPRLHERGFVLLPLAEIAPDLVHPQLQVTIRDLLSRVDCLGITLYTT